MARAEDGHEVVRVDGPRRGPPAGSKLTRDSFDVPNAWGSDNCIRRWGNSGGWPDSRAASVLDAFEESWQEILLDMDYNAPYGTDTYKFNLYIGDTGGPRAFGGAYYSSDTQGYPMIVITPGTFSNVERGTSIASHEFYHAMQGASGAPYAYGNNQPSAWYWEATANWIETQLYPENNGTFVAGFLPSFALLSYLPVNFFDYPDTGAFQEYYQYGAFIYAFYLTDTVADGSVIRESWLDARSNDPLTELDRILSGAKWGTSTAEVYFGLAAEMVNWDNV